MGQKACERLVRIEVLLTEEERHAFRVASVAERSTMRAIGRELILEGLQQRRGTSFSDST